MAVRVPIIIIFMVVLQGISIGLVDTSPEISIAESGQSSSVILKNSYHANETQVISPYNSKQDTTPNNKHGNTLKMRTILSPPIIRIDQPVFTQLPEDISYIYGTTGHNLTWVATDSGAKTYSIIRNGQTIVTGAIWTSGVPIVEVVDGLSVGTYNYTIEVIGKFDKISVDTAQVTVTEDNPPQFLSFPSDFTYYEGSTNNILSWNVSDSFPAGYTIYRNGTIIKQGSWNPQTLISRNIDGLLHGVYNFTIQVWDSFDNIATNTTFVTVIDQLDPILSSSPNNYTYAEGSTGNALSWTATDNNPIDFYIFRNGTQIVSSSWSSGSPININIDGLSVGVYNYTIKFSDINSNYIQDTVYVFVTDSTAPIFTQEPSNTSYTESTTGHQLIWKASEPNPLYYIVYRNGSQVTSDVWYNNAPISVNIDGLIFGFYNYTIVVFDSSGQFARSTRYVTVTDGTPPVLVSSSGNLQYAEGSSGNIIYWNATDSYPSSYVMYLDGSFFDTGMWDNQNLISLNVDGYSKGNYNFTIVIDDDSANSLTNTIWVTVVDLTDPILILFPSNSSYYEQSTGNDLEWNATDLYPGTYILQRDGIQISSNSWSNAATILYNIDGLLEGSYNFTIIVYDQSSNFAVHTVWVTVIDNVPPTFTSTPGNSSYIEGSTGNYIEWIPDDNHPKSFTLYRNNSILFSSAWFSGNPISINIDGLSTGIYNYTIVVRDDSQNIIVDTAWIEVIDTQPPVFSNIPADFSYSEGTTGHFVEWVASDNHPATYQILQEGVEVDNGIWVSGGSIRINVDGLSNGVYNYTIVVFDASNNWVKDTVYVEVANIPVFTNLPDPILYNLGDSGNTLSWTVSDSNPDWYLIYRNTTLVQNGSWINGIPITVNTDGLSLGIYNFTIHVNDTDGNTVFNSVLVEVADLPQWVYTPSNLLYNETSTGNFLSWNVTDSKPDNYYLYRNGTLIDTDQWTNADNITINIDGLIKGFYVYTIEIYDLTGNKIADQVNVTVFDGILPAFISTPSDFFYIEGTQGNTIEWNVSDSYPYQYTIYQNSSEVASGSWISEDIILLDIDGLLKNIYNFTIIIFDESLNFATDTVFVQIIDKTSPIIVYEPGNYSYPELSVGNTLTWNASDNYPLSYVLYRNQTQISTGSWNNSDFLTFDIDNLTEGLYNFTIIFFDESFNNVTSTSWVTITDIPVWLATPTDQIIIEGSQNNELHWRAEDSFPAFYLLFVDESLTQNTTWFSGINISINVDHLSKGIYNYSIQVFDTAGNYIVNEISITVEDRTIPELLEKSNDFSYSEGDTGNYVWWNISDLYPDYYQIFNNSIFYTSGYWNNNTRINIAIDGLVKGEYNFTIVVYDQSANNYTSTIIVNVIDTTTPLLVDKSADLSYSEADTGNYLFWNFTDSYPYSYTIYQDNTNVTSGTWNSSGTISINVDGLSLGKHNYTIQVLDQSGNFAKSTIFVSVVELNAPHFIQVPSETNYSEQNTTIVLNWEFEDDHPFEYQLLQNSTVIDSGTWSNGIIVSYELLNYHKGIYNFTMLVYDSSLNVNQSMLLLVISDIRAPTINQSPNPEITISEYSSGNIIYWNVTDAYPLGYKILKNSSELVSAVWSNDTTISLSLDSFTKGVYNLTIIIFDESGNYASDALVIHVVDDLNPEFICPCDDITYIEGSVGNSLVWTAEEQYPQAYTIYQNDTQVGSGGWFSNVENTRSIDGLVRGIYNFTIVVIDESSNQASITIFVTVKDTKKPNISTTISDIAYSEGTTGYLVNWTASDEHPGTYQVLRNGNVVISDTWTSGISEFINIDGLLKGVYNYTILIHDDSLNTISSTFFVSVIDTTLPVFIDEPDDFILSERVNETILTWTISESYPYGYSIYLNEEEIINESWDNSTISFSVRELDLGQYNLTLLVLDQSFNSQTDTVFFSVVDITPPEFISVPQNMTITLGTTGNALIWVARDNYASTYTIFRNEELLVQNFWSSNNQIKISVDNIPSGLYNYTIVVSDSSSNTASHSVIVWIKDPALTYTKAPTIDLVQRVYEGDSEELVISWYDDKGIKITGGRLVILLNDQQYYSHLANNTGNYEVILNYQGLAPGQYTWVFRFEKQFYESQEIIKHVTVKKNMISVKIQNLPELIQGKDFTIVAVVQFNNTIEGELALSIYKTRSGNVANLEVRFTISFINSEGVDDFIFKRATTDSDGIAKIVLNGDETVNIQKITTIHTSVSDNPFYENIESEQNPSELPAIKPPEPSPLEQLYSRVLELLIYIVLSLLSVSILYIWWRRRRNRIAKRNEEIMNIIVVAETELRSLQSLQAIIIQTVSGIPLYEVQFENLGVDSFLISGLSNAISSFLSELDKDETFGFEIMERQSISITSHKSDVSNIIVVSNRRIPLVVLDQLRKIHFSLDTEYRRELTEGRAGFDPLEVDDVNKLFERNGFKIGITDTLRIDSHEITILRRNRALSRIYRQRLELIQEFKHEIGNSQFMINELINFLKEHNIQYDMICRLIMLCYHFKIIHSR